MKYLLDGRRQCAKCRKYLPRTEFRRNARLRDGLASYCRRCAVAATRDWRTAHRDELNARKRAIHRERADHINALRRARQRARADEINAQRRRRYAARREE